MTTIPRHSVCHSVPNHGIDLSESVVNERGPLSTDYN